MPYFDLRPKERREDLFDREEELKKLERCVDMKIPLILVLGLRRYGKTSLVLTALNEMEIPYVYIDCRRLPVGPISYTQFGQTLAEGVSKLLSKHRGIREKVRRAISSLDSITVWGVEVRLKRETKKYDIIEMLHSLDSIGEKIAVVIDEAQELRRLRDFTALLAYAYDHMKNLVFILTGSEVGLLYKLLKTEDVKSWIYGRAYAEVKLKRLSRERSREFLVKGFKQCGITPSEKLIEEIINAVDGVIGWLTYAGYKIVVEGGGLEKIMREAENLSYSEFEGFLSIRKQARERYLAIMRAVAELGEASWSQIYARATAIAGRIPKQRFTVLLENLVDTRFLIKEEKYRIADPILERAIKRKYVKA